VPTKRDLDPDDAAEERASLVGLGLAVERLRRNAGMTRDAVAKKGGLTGNTVTHVEKNLKEQPKWGTLRRLAIGLGVELPELISLGRELAPGSGGDLLRERERVARPIDVESLVREAMEERQGKQT
jgi:transcriptional regulator with XRE-family HTH domain